jgi:hydrogenase/urease accessory protein HupE
VVPLGLDHILFVLGVFLLSRRWRPLLWQVTAFTLAHTLTLGLATLGIVRLPSSVVEPVIAASIAVIAVENIFLPKYNHWRLAIVFIFGLIHGLGFAGALADLELTRASLVTGLLGFNLGVEAGQLVVICAAFLATVWIKKEAVYRKAVVIPGSALIAVMGIWWMFERLLTRGE